MTSRKWMLTALLVGLALPLWAEEPVTPISQPDVVDLRRPVFSQAQREKMHAMTPAQRQEYMQTLRKTHRAAMRSACLDARKGLPVPRNAQGMGRVGGNAPVAGN